MYQKRSEKSFLFTFFTLILLQTSYILDSAEHNNKPLNVDDQDLVNRSIS